MTLTTTRTRLKTIVGVVGILAVVGGVAAGGVYGVRSGLWDEWRTKKTTPTTTVLQASDNANGLFDVADALVVREVDLPAALATYHASDDESGATALALAGRKTIAGHRAVFSGPDPLDIVTSTVFLFATSRQAAQAYVRATDPNQLPNVVGQSVELAKTITQGTAGIVFQEPYAVVEPDDARARRFGGAFVLNDRLVHLVVGLFPNSITTEDLAAVGTSALARYEKYGSVETTSERDADQDGLPDSIELLLGTSTSSKDSDADGHPDLIEVRNGYDPLQPGGAAVNT